MRWLRSRGSPGARGLNVLLEMQLGAVVEAQNLPEALPHSPLGCLVVGSAGPDLESSLVGLDGADDAEDFTARILESLPDGTENGVEPPAETEKDRNSR